MNISNWKLIGKLIFGGGVSGLIEYALEILNNALASLTEKLKIAIGEILAALGVK